MPTDRDLFQSALDLPDPAARAAYLDAHSPDADQRARVEKLLAAHAVAGGFLEDAAATGTFGDCPSGDVNVTRTGDGSAGSTADFAGPGEQGGAVIGGKYTLVEPIGEGGMGSVWRAKQTEPVKRFVAVKLIKAGMDSKQVLARFEAERQALALMDHPNIAKVLDGGLHEQRPYFVMELVKGVPITEYCDANKLTPKARLELFVQACQAIQHAHQKGVIHRDIKPSNVLVALYDDRPVVKVIDFGVAKATGGALTEKTLDTGFGGVVGTPQYMSPEQATFNNLDIDTRSDVYSLGVLLYELLTGSTPVDRKSLGKAALLEVLRIVREVEAPRPSAKLSTIDTLPSVAANRGTEPAKLSKLMKGELDWVLLKALEKDRTRRYDTANGLARDIQRYLADEIVEARPPSAGYRLKKFVRRHKGQVIAASLVLFALLAGMAGTTWGLIRAERSAEAERLARVEAQDERTNAVKAAEAERQARQDAEEKKALAEKAAEAERAAKLDAEAQKKRAVEGERVARAVTDFLRNKLLGQADVAMQADALLLAGDRATEAKTNPTIRELLDRAAGELAEAKIEANFPGQPLLQAELLMTVGNTYRGIGEAARGAEYLERSLALRKQHLAPDHGNTVITMNNLALAYHVAGKPGRAVPLFEEALRRVKARLGPDHPLTLTAMSNLAVAYQEAGKRDRVLPLLEEALRFQKAALGPDHRDTLTTMNNLVVVYLAAKKPDRAVPLAEEVFRRMKASLGPDHPLTLTAMNNLAMAYKAAGKLDLALPLLVETLTQRKARLGPDHPDTLMTMSNLATAYQEAGPGSAAR